MTGPIAASVSAARVAVTTSVPSATSLPATAMARGESHWIAYVWIAGMVVLMALVVWMAVTGRLFGRGRR